MEEKSALDVSLVEIDDDVVVLMSSFDVVIPTMQDEKFSSKKKNLNSKSTY